MYYNKLTGKLIIDPIDIFLISAFLSIQSARYLKEYLSEESKEKREKRKIEKLKNDLIKKSTLKKIPETTHSQKKIQKIYKFAINPRGGQIEVYPGELEEQFLTEFTLAQRIQKMVIETLIFLRSKEENKTKLRLIIMATRLGIELVLVACNIELEYVLINGIPKEFAVISACTGSTFGFIYGWFAAGVMLAGPPTLLTVFIVRSMVQQFMVYKQQLEITRFSHRLATDKEFRESILEAIKEQVENYNIIKLENLNWNSNPKIKEAAQRLGIFEHPPKINEPLHLETLDFDLELEPALQKLGLLKQTKRYSRKELTEFIKKTLEQNITNVPDLSTQTPSSENVIEIR